MDSDTEVEERGIKAETVTLGPKFPEIPTRRHEMIVLSGSETGEEEEYEDDSACSDDDDLDAPPKERAVKLYRIQSRSATVCPDTTKRRESVEKGEEEDAEDGDVDVDVDVDLDVDVELDGATAGSDLEEDSPPVMQKEKPVVKRVPRGDGKGFKIEWTEDEDEEELDGYDQWVQRKEESKRKRGIPIVRGGNGSAAGGGRKRQTKKPKLVEGSKDKPNKRGRGVGAGKPIVGIRAPPKVRKREVYDDAAEDILDEQLAQLPPQVQKRKEGIERKKRADDELAALKLPPTYEDVDFSDDERLEELAERPNFPNITPPGEYKDIELPTSLGIIPAPIAQWLREYQVTGARFLHEHFIYQRGGILGDDMGLGKTVQVIAFLTAAFGKTGDERDQKRMRKIRRLGRKEEVWYPRVLIVAPGTLMDNWKSELDTWGWWSYETYHGSKDDKESALKAAENGLCEIMITTYNTYKISRDVINRIPWDCVIADECHIIKERKSDTTKAMNEINALCRIGLTGTALQNKYEELWTLLNWCNPGSVGSPKIWNSTISRPLRLGQAHDATNRQLGNARRIARQLVTNLLPRMFIRRMKSLIASQLPKKSDRVVFCPLTATQTEAYENCCESEDVVLIKYSGDPCDCGSGKKRGYCCYERNEEGKHWKELVFPCIQNVQKLCNHIANWIPLNEEPPDRRAEKLDFLQTCLPDDWKRIIERPPMENYMDPELCGKWIILQKLLAFWHANDDKVLIFSYSIKLLDILRHLSTNTSYNVEYLDGKMALDDRARAVSNFNTSPSSFIFLISTRAGGVGLNITRANKVVIFDPSWNPSHDLQAQDRAYRIGQRRDVEVFRLVSAGTIEEIVYARQIYKQQQANIGYGASTERRYFKGVMGEEGRKGELFGLVNMFTFQGDRGPGGLLVKDVVNKTNVAEGRMGVSVIGYEGEGEDGDGGADDGDDDEDDPVSQLTALAAGGKGKGKRQKSSKDAAAGKMNPVQAILSAAGVQYTHENSEVIGSSAIEAEISKRALAATANTQNSNLGDTSAFGGGGGKPPNGTLETTPNPGTANNGDGGGGGGDDDNTVTLNGIVYHFHPPEDVKRRQFCEMSRMFGFPSVQEFALVVEGWTQGQRRKALERFYRIRRDARKEKESSFALSAEGSNGRDAAAASEGGKEGLTEDTSKYEHLPSVDKMDTSDDVVVEPAPSSPFRSEIEIPESVYGDDMEGKDKREAEEDEDDDQEL